MAHRNASPDRTDNLPAGTAAGVVVIDVAAANAETDAPSLIKVAPVGRIETRDGRVFSFDPTKLAARFDADGIDLPVDIDHSISRRAMFGERADAVGWVKKLHARADGLYAEVDWLEAGRAALAARTHRYVSPTFKHDDLGAATWLHSVALVAAPALAMPAVAAADPSHDPEHSMLKQIALSLGLAEGADEAACLAAIAEQKSGTVAKAVHEQALATLDATKTELETLKASNRAGAVEAVIEEALKAKKITPAQKGHYAALCATDDGFEGVKKLLAVTAAGLQPSDLDGKSAPDTDGEIDATALAAEAKVYRDEQLAKGNSITTADAVAAVKEKRK